MSTSKRESLDYEIDNVGGVKHASLRLRPGVNVLMGRNAAGKTSAMRAVVRAQGGKMPLERRDGTERGIVAGPGVVLQVRQVVKSTGEAELELADTGPLARLIDPGIKGTEAAARERIRALIELLDLAVDDDSLRTLCADDEGLFGWLRRVVGLEAVDDLMVAAEKLRYQAHAIAREDEEAAARAEALKAAAAERCARLLEEIGGIGALVDETLGAAKKLLDEAIREHERAVGQCEGRAELEAKQRSIHATLGEKPSPELAASLVSSLELELQDANARSQLAREEALRAERDEAIIRERVVTASKDLEKTRQSAALWDERDAILREPLTGPTADEVRELQVSLVEAARRRTETAQLSSEYREEEATKTAAEREREAAEKKAQRYRELAAGIPARLGEILRQAGAPGLTVVDGRLHALSNRGDPKDFENRCSTGERVALALDVAATAYEGKVLPLDGAFWASLDPAHREAFARLAEERGLYVLTEEPTGGELRVERVGSEASR